MQGKKIIISQSWGGLGDNLQYSTLPEYFTSLGYDVYISSKNHVRNLEIYDLVWGLNPYIKGVSDVQPNAGACKSALWPDANKNYYMIERIEISHGLEPKNTLPKIYYTPKYIPEHNNTILIDITGSSQVYRIEKYYEFIDYFAPSILDKGKKIAIPQFNKIQHHPIFNDVYKYLLTKIKNIYVLVIPSLIDYCDIINSCDTLILVNSGINSLAAAIKKDNPSPHILCYNPWSTWSDQQIKGFYNYRNIEYFKSSIP